jgi:hypothetical protein
VGREIERERRKRRQAENGFVQLRKASGLQEMDGAIPQEPTVHGVP